MNIENTNSSSHIVSTLHHLLTFLTPRKGKNWGGPSACFGLRGPRLVHLGKRFRRNDFGELVTDNKLGDGFNPSRQYNSFQSTIPCTSIADHQWTLETTNQQHISLGTLGYFGDASHNHHDEVLWCWELLVALYIWLPLKDPEGYSKVIGISSCQKQGHTNIQHSVVYPLVMTNITMDRTDPPFLMDKSTISMAMFNSYVKLPKGTCVLGQSYMCFFKTWYIYLMVHRNRKPNIMGLPSGGQCNPWTNQPQRAFETAHVACQEGYTNTTWS